MNKGFFMVIAPLSRGTHTLSASWEIESVPGLGRLEAALIIGIIVR